MDGALEAAVRGQPGLECAYVLGDSGLVISSTVCAPRPDASQAARRALFQPAERGADCTLRPYYLSMLAGLERDLTEPYLSAATGRMCRTLSASYEDNGGRRRVLCLDLDAATLAGG